ncbi:DUF2087 domain-containing protein [Cellulomonas sp. DKR-3]|uniref:DUF2087 domain-containing protein n=1 Tax=Cellulomonas fulva TaxID=2835530 RepID=A0ABS5TUM1_9CELL|nr:DUF2087 domain-containing protein [Cellulomonas fulva]MBT0992838.1 DUF2087 domain-containing protein [Cellulomonas fulva]
MSVDTPGTPDGRPCAAERFLEHGRLVRSPRRAQDRDLVLDHLAGRVLAPGERTDERELTARLAALVVDPVRTRRDLVEAGLVGRRGDGSVYWRERGTPHDDEPGARPRPDEPWFP